MSPLSNSNHHEPQWMAVYTAPRAEKKVHKRLEAKGIESYLPLKKEQRQWSDRKKMVEVPIISSYVFVKCTASARREVLKTDGILNFVFYRGKPAIIRDEEMERMWRFLADYQHRKLEVKRLEPGQKVTIESGPLKGNSGEVVYTNNKNRVCIQLETLGLQIRAEVEGVMLQE